MYHPPTVAPPARQARRHAHRAAVAGAVVMVAALVTTLAAVLLAAASAGEDVPTEFSNRDGIINTRHNLTQRAPGGTINAGLMDSQRNDYGEVCVYCHTPHGASGVVDAPLWNRTRSSAAYTTYDGLNSTTLSGPVSAPGVNSLTCLSCHDGTLGVDSIINMPGSGFYFPSQQTSQDNSLLDQWATVNPDNAGATHVGLTAPDQGCLVCHSPDGAGAAFPTATDFRAFAIGTDLRNDHPVGVAFPSPGPGVDFNPTSGQIAGQMDFYDANGNGRADVDEIRLYDSGEGPEVECASCHDPHGVPSAGTGSQHNPSFLRVAQSGSGVCLTCHDK